MLCLGELSTEWEHENSARQNALGNAVKTDPLLTKSTVLTFSLYFSSSLYLLSCFPVGDGSACV